MRSISTGEHAPSASSGFRRRDSTASQQEGLAHVIELPVTERVRLQSSLGVGLGRRPFVQVRKC
jgi:hypothetical protein